MSSDTSPDPAYLWATNDRPDFLALQPAPVPAISGGEPVDVLRGLLARRGFTVVEQAGGEQGDLDLRASTGCLLTRGDDGEVALLVRVSDRVGATRFVLPGLDPAWWARAEATGHAAVLVTTSAVAAGGTTTREDLRADVEVGGVRAALVPTDSRAPA